MPSASPGSPPLPADYRPDIDGLRAFAVSAVLLFHYFPDLLPGGFVGVDVFFVISGYLIGRILLGQLPDGRFSFASFYAARILRIFPALALVIAATLAAGWLLLFPDEYATLGRHALWGATFIENFGLLGEQGYFDTATELKPLMHLWSLAIEEQFYLLFPAVLWTAGRYGRKPLSLILTTLILSFALDLLGIGSHATRTFFSPQTRFWELMAGAVLAHASLGLAPPEGAHPPPRKLSSQGLPGRQPPTTTVRHQWFSMIGLVLLLTSVLTIPTTGFPGAWALAPVAGAALVIAAGATAPLNRLLLAAQPMRRLGLISYPLYLWHWPLLALMKIVCSGSPPVALRLAGLAASVLLATLTYVWLEKPIRYGSRSTQVVRRLLLAMALAALAGLQIEREGGWPERPAIRSAYAQVQALRFHRPRNPACDARFPAFASSGYCEQSANDPTTPAKVVLLGDSHANMLYWGLAETLRGYGHAVAQYGHPACLPFLDIGVHQRGEADHCAETMNMAIRLAAGQREVRTVILAARGPLYLSGRGFGDIPSEQRLDILLSDATGRPAEDSRLNYAKALERTLDYFRAHGKRVIVVIDVPELGFSPQACIARPGRPAATPGCSLSYADYLDRARDYRRLLAEIVARHPEAVLFDASRVFCDEQHCRARDGDELLYRDGDHPSLVGAVRIAERMWDEVLTH